MLHGSAACDTIVLDPTLTEDLTCDTTITIAMNTAKEVCALQKSGGYSITKDQLNECMVLAFRRSQELAKALDAVLEQREKAEKHQIFADASKAPLPVGRNST